MAEVEFEENCAEIKDYLRTVRECKQHITQIPALLKQLLEMLNTSTALLENLCTFDDAPDSLQWQCVRSRQQMLSFYEGSALKDLTDSIQGVVHQRLMRMEQIAQQSYTTCKRRREARATYLSDTTAKRPFNLTASSPEKLQRHKDAYTSKDEAYRRACDEFAGYRYAEMGTVQRDFYSGYSGVFALLTNALNLPTGTGDDGGNAVASTTTTTTRDRLRGQQRHSRGLRAPVVPASGENSRRDTTAAMAAAAAPPLAAEESCKPQRRVSDGGVIGKFRRVGAARAGSADVDDDDGAGGKTWQRTSSARSGEVVDGIPVTGERGGYGGETYSYMSSPSKPTARVAGHASSSPVALAESSSSSTSISSSNDSNPFSVEVGNASGGGGGATSTSSPRATVRKSSSATLNHFDRVSPDVPPLRHEYSMFSSFDDR